MPESGYIRSNTPFILVADDSKAIHAIYRQLFEEWGFHAIYVLNGQEALDIYASGEGPPIAILDWEMPVMNGVEVCQEIRKLTSIHQPYLVMVSQKDRARDKVKALESGADDFISKPFEKGELRARIGVGQRINSLQRRLFSSLEQLRGALNETEGVVEAISSLLIEVDESGVITRWNQVAERIFARSESDVIGCRLEEASLPWDGDVVREGLCRMEQTRDVVVLEEVGYWKPTGQEGELRLSLNPLVSTVSSPLSCLVVGDDMTHRKRLEAELMLAQKMDSLGHMAAGIAHEINTPTQYVSTNLQFLHESFATIHSVLGTYDTLMQMLEDDDHPPDRVAALKQAIEDADLEFLRDEVPHALEQSVEGAERVAHIVRAMKEFSQPHTGERKAVYINEAVENTLTVAEHLWRNVAEVEKQLDPTVPPVSCLAGELNQVIFNIISNAAYAISDVVRQRQEEGHKGLLTVSTAADHGWVEIRITDTGFGVPAFARDKIFDPFFTTKGVGQGTGQGLAVARDIVVNKHGGKLTFETEDGKGSTFIVRLPLEAAPATEPNDVAT